MTVAYAYVLEHTGTGPLWGQLVEENGRICREHMWRNLLYVHNLWPFEQMVRTHVVRLLCKLKCVAPGALLIIAA